MDVFRLDVPQDATDVTIRSAGVHGRVTGGCWTPSHGRTLTADTSEGNFRIETRLDAGVLLRGGRRHGDRNVPRPRLGRMADVLRVRARDHAVRDDGGDAESSTLMPNRSAARRALSPIRIGRRRTSASTCKAAPPLEVRTSGPTDTRGELLDATGARLLSDDDSGPGGHNFLVRADLEAGIYYVAVSGEPGDYAVMTRLGDAPDHGGTEATATLLTLYAAEDLDRVSPSALLAAPGKIAPDVADVDVFRLDVAENGTDVAIRSAGATDVFAQLVDSSLDEIATDTSAGNFRLEERLDAGTYYVVVRGRETGTYRVLAWRTSVVPCGCAGSMGSP